MASTLLSAGIGLAVVFQLPRPPLVYSRAVSEFLAQPTRETRVRVHGNLVPGSLCQQLAPCEFRFRMIDESVAFSSASAAREPLPAELEVRYPSCTIPDTFGDEGCEPRQRVVVEGEQCASCHAFEASQVMMTCTGKYQIGARHRSRKLTSLPVCPP